MSKENGLHIKKSSNAADWKVGTSSSLFRRFGEKELIACKEAGVEYIELCLFARTFDLSKDALTSACQSLAQKAGSIGVKFWSIHLPFGNEWDISAPDEDFRKAIIQKLVELMESSACLKAQKAVIHGSFEPIHPDERSARLKACRESLSELSIAANRLGMQLAVECLPRTCLGNTTAEMLHIIEGIDLLGVCCDMNHLLTDKAEDFIKALGSRLVSLHVSDYDRVDERHWMPGRGLNDWNAIIEALEQIGYDGPFLFEVGRHDLSNPIRPADLKRCWDKLLEDYLSNSKHKSQ
mgnify:CR=1 FL=1